MSITTELFVEKSNISGRGLFTKHTINKGSIVMLWNNKANIIKEDEYNELQRTGEKIILNTGVRYVGNLFLYTDNLDRYENYINHSDDPNTIYHCGICFAKRYIESNEELTVDYRYLLSEYDDAGFYSNGESIIGHSAEKALLESSKQLMDVLKSNTIGNVDLYSSVIN